MTRQDAVNWINTTNGKIFSVEFTKRTSGETRIMHCRTGVVRVKGDLGSGPAYNPEEKGLILVFDFVIQAYRTIPKKNITRIKVDGEWRDVTE